MPTPATLPRYVYKIIPSAPPEPIPESYPLSELDQKDGFVHLSASWQIPITAGLFFKDSTELWIIKLELSHFTENTKWDEVPDSDGCPHLYGNFGSKDVVSVQKFSRGKDQDWKEVFEKKSSVQGFNKWKDQDLIEGSDKQTGWLE